MNLYAKLIIEKGNRESFDDCSSNISIYDRIGLRHHADSIEELIYTINKFIP